MASDNQNRIDYLNFSNLEHFEIIDSSKQFVADFPTVWRKLTALKLDLKSGLGIETSLMATPNLEDLSVQKDAILFTRFMLDYPFQLKKLTIGHMFEREVKSAIEVPVEFQRYLPNKRLIHFLMNQSD